ncbi:MAG: GNAT family N-acetyltransferase [Acidimicrobiia bacterium]
MERPTTAQEVRRIRSEEWRILRKIRLEALADAPGAFSTTLEDAQTYPDAIWQDRASKGAVGGSQATILAFDNGIAVGMAVGLLRAHISRDVAPIVSVFVSSGARRRGIGERLMDEVEAWARRNGAVTTSLWVAEANTAARSFYQSRGYQSTSDRQQIAETPTGCEIRMVKNVSVQC